ncbi:hypothetical protein EDC63_106112 [Sulfurirhabdus autotrophica]|uniref:Uncharacterized protein n=1 Tax=Sulfurirhabdus autotrophica TaxID=1706046 RepID=A0A4R3Y5M5_9PROT|nr:hypothetical protein EDC63_106112 [Sulfurirhabdus autotrophica]
MTCFYDVSKGLKGSQKKLHPFVGRHAHHGRTCSKPSLGGIGHE